MPDFTYEDRKQLEKAAGELAKASRRIVQIVINSKDDVIGLRNDGKLFKYNFETRKWEEV